MAQVQTLSGNWLLWLLPLTIICIAIMIPVVRYELGISKTGQKKEITMPANTGSENKADVIPQNEDEMIDVVIMAAAAYVNSQNKYGGQKMKNLKITVNGKTYDVTVEEENQNGYTPRYNVNRPTAATEEKKTVSAENKTAAAPVSAPAAPAAAPVSSASGDNKLEAPMSGRVVEVSVAVGDKIKAGDCVIVMEAMKLQSEVCSDFDGVVKEIHVKEKQDISTGDLIAVIG